MQLSKTTTEADLFEIAMQMPWLILDVELALDEGIFDEATTLEAEIMLACARRFLSQLLSQAWPEFTSLQPHDEVKR